MSIIGALLLDGQERPPVDFSVDSFPETHFPSAGPAAGSTSSSHGEAASGNNPSQHHVRMQAAIAAATVYGKSFVYPSPNAFIGYYFSLCSVHTHKLSCRMPIFALGVGG